MSDALYVALSGQMALERRMNTIADNIANVNTPGFRATGVRFETVLGRLGAEDLAFSSSGESFVSLRSGPISHSGNPLDVAVEGSGWLAVGTPDGPAYTRDGRLRLNERGELRSAAGLPVLDPGGAPVVLDPAGGAIVIAADGSISQDGRQVGALGLFELPANARLSRAGSSAVRSDLPATALQDPAAGGVRQGYVEGSNVDPMLEMVKLIEVSRAFEAAASAVQQSDTSRQDAIRQLGPA